MSDEPIDAWDPPLRIEAGALLSAVLQRSAERAHAVARGLAPEGPGAGIRYGIYEGTLRYPKREVAYRSRFTELSAFLALLEAGDPGAIELGLVIAAELDAESVVPVARLLSKRAVWLKLGQALGRALGKGSSEAGFGLLLGGPPDRARTPYLRDGLSTHGYPGGVERAWAAYRASGGLDRAGLTPEERVDTEPVLGYLVRHDRERAFAELRRLVAGEASPFVAHTLSRMGDDGREVLLATLESAPPGARLTFAQRLAVKLLLERDVARAVDALGGETFLAAPAGRPRLLALIDQLRDDTFRVQRGWLAADPRFSVLIAGLSGDADRELASLATDLLRTLPAARGAKRAAKPKRAAPASVSPDAALLRELEEMRGALGRLVAHLRREGYRFAAPRSVLVAPRVADQKALARLEKTVAVPPVLAAFWRTVGSVDLRGTDPRWSATGYLGFPGAREPAWLTAPLVVAPAAAVIADALEDRDAPPLALHLGPDTVGKAGYSGAALTVWLPQEQADPLVNGSSLPDLVDQTLLEHLRLALSWGGFPGMKSIADRPEPWLAAARAAIG